MRTEQTNWHPASEIMRLKFIAFQSSESECACVTDKKKIAEATVSTFSHCFCILCTNTVSKRFSIILNLIYTFSGVGSCRLSTFSFHFHFFLIFSRSSLLLNVMLIRTDIVVIRVCSTYFWFMKRWFGNAKKMLNFTNISRKKANERRKRISSQSKTTKPHWHYRCVICCCCCYRCC